MRRTLYCIVLLVLTAAAVVAAVPCTAQDISSAQKKFQAHARKSAAEYDLRADSPAGRKLALRPEPILHWTNPVPERQMHGDVFLWTDDGRPAAVLCLFEMTENGMVRECHEFCSLAAGPLVTIGAADRRWSPAKAQVTMSPVPGAPPPAATPRQRLAQMRELASRFECEKTNRQGDKSSLRLLPQPVERYESRTHAVTDGALFAFVEATDPEAFLLLEARLADGALRWHNGLARMASVRMQVSYGKQTVWEVETLPYGDFRNRPERPYTTLFMR